MKNPSTLISNDHINFAPGDGWIGVDLDGTLAVWDHWRSMEHIGDPIPLMAARVERWIKQGHDVRIFTARMDGGRVAIAMGDPNGLYYRDRDAVRAPIQAYTKHHFGIALPVTNEKDYGMRVLFDDRAVRVGFNTGEIEHAPPAFLEGDALPPCPCGAPCDTDTGPYTISTAPEPLWRLDCQRADCGWCVISTGPEQAYQDWRRRS